MNLQATQTLFLFLIRNILFECADFLTYIPYQEYESNYE